MRFIWPMYAALALAGCGNDSTETATDAGFDLGADLADEPSTSACQVAHEMECVDELILDLALHADKVTTGRVLNVPDGDDWITTVDATAGGFGQEQNNPWVYVRFEDDGVARVDIDDETALERLDWHLAVRRFVIRTNGGTSGPASCVGAAAFPHLDYVDLDQVPVGLTYDDDDFYTADCDLIDDGSGLGSPRTAIGDWWVYDGCVQTTLTPFLVRLDDERVIKLVVESYYQTGQERCNESSVPGTNGGVFVWRWRFLD